MNNRTAHNIPRDDEAFNLLMLVNSPELLETRTLADIHSDMKRAGYAESEPGKIRSGWQRKYEGKNSDKKTAAMIRTADGKLIELCIGDDGLYSLAVLVENADAVTREELAPAKQFLSGYRTHLTHMFAEGPAFKRAADKIVGTPSSPSVDRESRTYVERIRALFGKDLHNKG